MAGTISLKRNVQKQRNSSSAGKDHITGYLHSFIDLSSLKTVVVDSNFPEKENAVNRKEIRNMVVLDILNRIPSLNDFLTKVNNVLPEEGRLACCFKAEKIDSSVIRRTIRLKAKSLMRSIYKTVQYLSDTDRSGKDIEIDLPLPEGLGRIMAGGFEIIDYKEFDGLTYVIAEKKSDPQYNADESDGAIFKMKRIGKEGKFVDYYKFRTMYAYAQYLQGFVYQRNGLRKGDKIYDDFRITELGRIMRRYWIDELPMLINLFKGDLKLVGVRPLSSQKFNLYDRELRRYRTKFKPGLIPPFYADMPDSFDELMQSEAQYLSSYEKAPLKTDIKYFFKSIYNIFVKGARSS